MWSHHLISNSNYTTEWGILFASTKMISYENVFGKFTKCVQGDKDMKFITKKTYKSLKQLNHRLTNTLFDTRSINLDFRIHVPPTNLIHNICIHILKKAFKWYGIPQHKRLVSQMGAPLRLVANQQGSYDNCARCCMFLNIKCNIF